MPPGRPKGSKNKKKAAPKAAPKEDVEVPVLPSTSTSVQKKNKKTEDGRGRMWCFTLHGVSEEKPEFRLKPEDHSCIRYLCWQLERGAETGRLHYQGFVQLYSSQRFSYVKGLIPCAHWTLCDGTSDENEAYCTKSETKVDGPWRYGVRVTQGARVELADVIQDVLTGKKRARDVMEEDPQMWMRNYRALAVMETSRLPRRNFKPVCEWYWGKAGCGKTRGVYDKYGDENIYVKDASQWWDGYVGQQVILLDDFSKPADDYGFRDFLRLFDRYAYSGQVKGSTVQICSPIMIVTCEYPPETFWKGNELAQVRRRFEKVECVSK